MKHLQNCLPWQFCKTKPENAISRFLHFQRLTAVENGGSSLNRSALAILQEPHLKKSGRWSGVLRYRTRGEYLPVRSKAACGAAHSCSTCRSGVRIHANPLSGRNVHRTFLPSLRPCRIRSVTHYPAPLETPISPGVIEVLKKGPTNGASSPNRNAPIPPAGCTSVESCSTWIPQLTASVPELEIATE